METLLNTQKQHLAFLEMALGILLLDINSFGLIIACFHHHPHSSIHREPQGAKAFILGQLSD